MNVQRIAAFSDGNKGGNPAGVVLLKDPLTESEMRSIATEVGYSETAFAYPLAEDESAWRVRYFSPESEVPFCGHATIALGAVLGEHAGAGEYKLTINSADIAVNTVQTEQGVAATLTSPPTHSRPVTKDELTQVLNLFGLSEQDLDARLSPAYIHGGSNHIVLPLQSRQTLASMAYSLTAGKTVMEALGLVTIMLVYIESPQVFVVRNAFASGGVIEDPATGAAAAAFAGYLRDAKWPHNGQFTIRQGEDMGAPSVIRVSLSEEKGSPVSVSGTTRNI